ncbi:hypothetical protein D3C87_1050940 [compost metagenome]
MADADQRVAEARAQQHRQCHHRQHQRHQHQPVEVHRVVDGQRAVPQQAELGPEVDIGAVAAAGDLCIVEHEIDHLGEGQRDHDEVHAARAQHQRPHHQRQCPRRAQRAQQQQPAVAGPALGCQHGRGIGGHGEVGGMAQAHQPGVANQQLEREREDRHDHHLAQQLDIELVAVGGQQQRRHGQHGQRHEPAQRRQPGRPAHVLQRGSGESRFHRWSTQVSRPGTAPGASTAGSRPSRRRSARRRRPARTPCRRYRRNRAAAKPPAPP